MAWINWQFIRVAAALIGAGLIVIGAIFTYEPLMIGVIMVLAIAYSVYAKRYPDAILRISVSKRWRLYLMLGVVLCYVGQVVLLDIFLDEAERWNWAWIAFDIVVLVGMMITLAQNYSLSERLAATDPGGQNPDAMLEILAPGPQRLSAGSQRLPARLTTPSAAAAATPSTARTSVPDVTGGLGATGAAATISTTAAIERRYPPGLWTAAGCPALYVREITVMFWMVAYMTLIIAKMVFIYINSRPTIDDFWGNDTCVLFLGIIVPIVIGYRLLLEPAIRSYSLKMLLFHLDCFVFATDVSDALSFWRLSQLGLVEHKLENGIGAVCVAFVSLALVAAVFMFLYPFIFSRNDGLETVTGRKRRPAPWILIFRYTSVLCIDIPLIVLRFVIWIRFDTAISAFIIKNAACILIFRGIWTGPPAMQLFHRHNHCPCTDPAHGTEIIVPVRRSQKENDQTIAALNSRIGELEAKVDLRERQLRDHKRVLEQFNTEMDRVMEEVAAKDRLLQSTNDQQQMKMQMQQTEADIKPSAARSLYADLLVTYPTMVSEQQLPSTDVHIQLPPPQQPQQQTFPSGEMPPSMGAPVDQPPPPSLYSYGDAQTNGFYRTGAVSRTNTPAGFAPPIVNRASSPTAYAQLSTNMLPRGMISAPVVY